MLGFCWVTSALSYSAMLIKPRCAGTNGRRGALHSVAHDGAGQLNPITRDFLDATIERASGIYAEAPAAAPAVYDPH